MSSFNYRDHITTGTYQEALDWIKASSLQAEEKEALARFVNRFPGLTFYKEDDAALDYVEQNENVQLPNWLRTIRKTLTYVNPNERVMFQLSRFDGWSPREDALNEIWYRFGLIGYSDDEDREILEPEQLFPIAEAWRTGRSIMAIKLDNTNTKIYEYNMQDLWDNASEGESPGASVRDVLSSYTILLDRIIAIQPINGSIIQATKV